MEGRTSPSVRQRSVAQDRGARGAVPVRPDQPATQRSLDPPHSVAPNPPTTLPQPASDPVPPAQVMLTAGRLPVITYPLISPRGDRPERRPPVAGVRLAGWQSLENFYKRQHNGRRHLPTIPTADPRGVRIRPPRPGQCRARVQPFPWCCPQRQRHRANKRQRLNRQDPCLPSGSVLGTHTSWRVAGERGNNEGLPRSRGPEATRP